MPDTSIGNRLTGDDIKEMAARTRQLLSPEGAQSWYVLDVTRLLEEVSMIRAELHDAINQLATDGIDRDDLRVMMARWKDQAAGIHQSRQFKRHEAAIKAVRDDLRMTRASMDKLTAEAEQARVEREAKYEIATKALRDEITSYASALEQEHARAEQSAAEIVRLNMQIEKLERGAAEAVAMARAQFDAERAEWHEKLDALRAAVG